MSMSTSMRRLILKDDTETLYLSFSIGIGRDSLVFLELALVTYNGLFGIAHGGGPLNFSHFIFSTFRWVLFWS